MGNPQYQQPGQRSPNHPPITPIQFRQPRKHHGHGNILNEIRVCARSHKQRIYLLDIRRLADLRRTGFCADAAGAARGGAFAERAVGGVALSDDALGEEEVVSAEGEGVDGRGCWGR